MNAPPPIRRSYGWVPDVPDQRDHLYGVLRAVPRELPPAVDLRPQCSPVENQGALNSCTAAALVGVMEFLERRQKLPFVDLSRLFIYYNERVLEHATKADGGAMLRDGIKTLVRQGVCPEALWPYQVSRVFLKPSSRCYQTAVRHAISSYQRLLTLGEMRACLAEGYPFVFGFAVYESFESAQVARTGVTPMPQPDERVLGGHAVMAVGYDERERRFIVRNSWGGEWGMKGYFTLPYAYLVNRNLSDDFWTIRR